MKPTLSTSELLSALADNELGDPDFAAALQACAHDEAALACWNTYHLIGDVLRSSAFAAAPFNADADLAFVGRLNQRLAMEAPIAAGAVLAQAGAVESVQPANSVQPVKPDHPVVASIHHSQPASNDGNFRWKLVAGVASLAAVSALVWNVSGTLAPAASPQLAQVPAAQIVVASPQGMMVRDARLEELLAAHRQFGAGSALQESSGFFKNAALDAPQSPAAPSSR